MAIVLVPCLTGVLSSYADSIRDRELGVGIVKQEDKDFPLIHRSESEFRCCSKQLRGGEAKSGVWHFRLMPSSF